MSNDNKTLADVQPGGRVRLGDQAERARFEAWLATQHDQGSEHVMATVSATDDRYQSPVTSSMWSAWQAANSAREGGRINGWKVVDGVRVYSAYAHASILDDQQYVRYEDYLAALSAQPSPGGQDALAALQQDYDKLLDSFNRQVEVAEKIAGRALQQDDRIEELEEALAARQPVGDEEQPYNLGGIELTACQLHEALLMAGDPELDVPFEDRSLVRIFWTETGHSGPGLYCECVGAEEEGCILLDGTAPAIGRPAQAVDLDAVRALLQRRIEQWRSHLPSDPDAPGTREIETKGEHDYNNDVRIYREGIAVMEEVLSKINSQAVGK